MTTIDGIGMPAAAPAARRARTAVGFSVPPDTPTADEPSAPDGAAPILAAFMDGLLGLQEQASDVLAPAMRDREARRHGQALLSMLAELQLALVDPRGSPALVAEQLAGLAGAVPVAADPRLHAIVAAIALRARIEMARREM